MNSLPTVSVVIPIHNEERYIEACLDSLLNQDYPMNLIECVCVDGMSTDSTREILERYTTKYPFIRVIDNPEKSVQFALNHGIRAARHEYIVRFDAHSEYAMDYVRKCIEFHQKTDAQNIGGPNIVMGRSDVQKAIAAAYYSPFALGGGRNHIEGYEGYADTVSFGSFKKETAEKNGLFDEDLTLNEDDDFNFRLIEDGGKVYITPEIRSTYYPRDNYRALFRQYFLYGEWKVPVIKKHGKPARLSHLIPLFFFMFIVFGGLLSLVLPFAWIDVVYYSVLAIYLGIDIYVSMTSQYIATTVGKWRLVWVHFVLHFAYGLGFFVGIFKFRGDKWNTTKMVKHRKKRKR